MSYPSFYDRVESIVVRDGLADLLGAFDTGIIEYKYLDVVRLAGHSCPTVAGAFLMASRGLKALYGDEMPVRGKIRVEMQERLGEGVCGVIANVFSLITGATEDSGFHGLAGKYDRRFLLSYGNSIPSPVRFTDSRTGKSVQVSYDPNFIPGDPRMGELFSVCLSGDATEEETAMFHKLWQGRVEAILCEHANDPRLIKTVLDG